MPVVVTREVGTSHIEELGLRPVEARDVVVRIDASGICHSDVAVLNGELSGPLPVALGHEGAGTIVDVGSGVTSVTEGDRVVLSAVPSCGACWFCSRGDFNLCELSHPLRRPGFVDSHGPVRGSSGLGTFSDVVLVDERAVVPVETSLPAEQLALIGCAILTGAGTVFNIAAAAAGTSVLVVGAGGIGLAAVQAGRTAGALPIAVVDPSAEARAKALECGATAAVAPPESAALLDLTNGRGFDVVIECVASEATLAIAWPLTRRGGEIVLVGVTPPSERFPISIVDVVLSGRRLSGCVYGGASPRRDIPRYVALAEAGHLDFSTMIGRTITLDEVPAALATPGHGAGRTVVVNTSGNSYR
jgi:S-(hydroxymethyl)glutathione dehydrogenase / alcohol dehydrogenase